MSGDKLSAFLGDGSFPSGEGIGVRLEKGPSIGSLCLSECLLLSEVCAIESNAAF